VSGGKILVGALDDDDSGDESGSVYLFGRDHEAPEQWTYIDKLAPERR
jgi:hypothetical protein